MRLRRRDVLAALSAVGVTATAGCAVAPRSGGPVDERDVTTLVAVAEAVYPTTVEDVEGFVRDYSLARVRADEEYGRGVADAVATLDRYATELHSETYAALSTDRARALLHRTGVDTADPAPDGGDAARVRYYAVNELLYALYTSPTGAGLAGLENPPGHPGGLDSYRRGPR